jgi:hypothetical protein
MNGDADDDSVASSGEGNFGILRRESVSMLWGGGEGGRDMQEDRIYDCLNFRSYLFF